LPTIQLSQPLFYVDEGGPTDLPVAYADITVTLSLPAAQDVYFHLATGAPSSGTPASLADYTPIDSDFPIARNSTVAHVQVPITNDNDYELAERIGLRRSG